MIRNPHIQAVQFVLISRLNEERLRMILDLTMTLKALEQLAIVNCNLTPMNFSSYPFKKEHFQNVKDLNLSNNGLGQGCSFSWFNNLFRGNEKSRASSIDSTQPCSS